MIFRGGLDFSTLSILLLIGVWPFKVKKLNVKRPSKKLVLECSEGFVGQRLILLDT